MLGVASARHFGLIVHSTQFSTEYTILFTRYRVHSPQPTVYIGDCPSIHYHRRSRFFTQGFDSIKFMCVSTWRAHVGAVRCWCAVQTNASCNCDTTQIIRITVFCSQGEVSPQKSTLSLRIWMIVVRNRGACILSMSFCPSARHRSKACANLSHSAGCWKWAWA